MEQRVPQRRRIKQTISLKERLCEEAKRLREWAQSLPLRAERNLMMRRAMQAETGAHMSGWLKSPGPAPPK